MNFSYLLEKSTADYVMLCDQDDVWVADKIAPQMEKKCLNWKPRMAKTSRRLSAATLPLWTNNYRCFTRRFSNTGNKALTS